MGIISENTCNMTSSEFSGGNLSERTIEFYLTRIKEKLKCKNKHELINKSFELGFIDLMFIMF